MLMTQFALNISVQSYIFRNYNVQMAAGNSNHIITHKGKQIQCKYTALTRNEARRHFFLKLFLVAHVTLHYITV